MCSQQKKNHVLIIMQTNWNNNIEKKKRKIENKKNLEEEMAPLTGWIEALMMATKGRMNFRKRVGMGHIYYYTRCMLYKLVTLLLGRRKKETKNKRLGQSMRARFVVSCARTLNSRLETKKKLFFISKNIKNFVIFIFP